MRDVFPTTYKAPEWRAVFAQYVFVNWLDVQVECKLNQDELKVLEGLQGWRNREVRMHVVNNDYTKAMFAPDAAEKRRQELDYLKEWAKGHINTKSGVIAKTA